MVDPITAGIYVINQQEPLQYIAERTGGRAILSANDVTPGLQRFRQEKCPEEYAELVKEYFRAVNQNRDR
jgi:hypothetical protein